MSDKPLVVQLIVSPELIHGLSIGCIIGYYVVTYFALKAIRRKDTKSIWRKWGTVDIITSVTWVLAPIVLGCSLFAYCWFGTLSLATLVAYYFYFVFFFSFLYCLAEWHFPGSLYGVSGDTWKSEWCYFIVSLQTQTGLGYTRARPDNWLTEFISGVQILVGILFWGIFIARAVG